MTKVRFLKLKAMLYSRIAEDAGRIQRQQVSSRGHTVILPLHPKIYSNCLDSIPILLGLRYRHVGLHVGVVVCRDLPFASVFHQDLQQARAEAPLVIRIRSGK